MGELEARIQMLEDENIAQRHMIQLGELRKQKENEDMRKYHTRLIHELEQEKRKLEEEICQVYTVVYKVIRIRLVVIYVLLSSLKK